MQNQQSQDVRQAGYQQPQYRGRFSQHPAPRQDGNANSNSNSNSGNKNNYQRKNNGYRGRGGYRGNNPQQQRVNIIEGQVMDHYTPPSTVQHAPITYAPYMPHYEAQAFQQPQQARQPQQQRYQPQQNQHGQYSYPQEQPRAQPQQNMNHNSKNVQATPAQQPRTYGVGVLGTSYGHNDHQFNG